MARRPTLQFAFAFSMMGSPCSVWRPQLPGTGRGCACHLRETSAMRSKLQTLEEAARLVKDGDQVVMSANMNKSPMALLRQLVRQGSKNLRTVGVVGGEINLDFLVGAGVASSVDP